MSEINNTPVQDDALDILNIFNEQSSSTGLEAGVHERVKLISVDPEKRKDNNGNPIKKQLFLKFKKFSKDGNDIGEKEISFFLIDPSRETAISNLQLFLAQTRELLSVFVSSEELVASYDPISVVYDANAPEFLDRDDEDVEADFGYDVIKKRVLKKSSMFAKIEQAACDQFYEILKDKIGFESESFRLKLEESKDGKYVQIPRFDRYVEKSSVKKEDSALYNATN